MIRDRLKETMLQKHHPGLRATRKGSTPNMDGGEDLNAATTTSQQRLQQLQGKKTKEGGNGEKKGDEGDEDEDEDEEDEDEEDEGEEGEDKEKDVFVSDGEADIAMSEWKRETSARGEEENSAKVEVVVEVEGVVNNSSNSSNGKGEGETLREDAGALPVSTTEANASKEAHNTVEDIAEVCKDMGLNLDGYEVMSSILLLLSLSPSLYFNSFFLFCYKTAKACDVTL